MSVVNRAMLLLLLAAIGTNASPENCDGLNKTLPAKDLDKIVGDWVLVWSVSEGEIATELLANLTSSRMEFHLLPDNHTFVYNERNLFHDKSCTKYFLNMSVPSETSDSDDHSLHTFTGTFEKDGVATQYNNSGVVHFFESCPDCLTMVYKGNEGHYLLSYKRDGHHQDVEQLKAAHGDHHKLAECLGFPVDKPFSYDGAADFCPEKSAEQS